MSKAWVHQVRVVVSVPDLDCLCFWGNDTGRNRSPGMIIAPVPRHAEDGCEESRIASNRLLWGEDWSDVTRCHTPKHQITRYTRFVQTTLSIIMSSP